MAFKYMFYSVLILLLAILCQIKITSAPQEGEQKAESLYSNVRAFLFLTL
jgi:hypothetical protein